MTASNSKVGEVERDVSAIAGAAIAKIDALPVPKLRDLTKPEASGDLVELVAFAIARVIAYRHGHKPDDWLNDQRREEARAAIATLSSINRGVE